MRADEFTGKGSCTSVVNPITLMKKGAHGKKYKNGVVFSFEG
jgi:hypothetical protein